MKKTSQINIMQYLQLIVSLLIEDMSRLERFNLMGTLTLVSLSVRLDEFLLMFINDILFLDDDDEDDLANFSSLFLLLLWMLLVNRLHADLSVLDFSIESLDVSLLFFEKN